MIIDLSPDIEALETKVNFLNKEINTTSVYFSFFSGRKFKFDNRKLSLTEILRIINIEQKRIEKLIARDPIERIAVECPIVENEFELLSRLDRCNRRLYVLQLSIFNFAKKGHTSQKSLPSTMYEKVVGLALRIFHGIVALGLIKYPAWHYEMILGEHTYTANRNSLSLSVEYSVSLLNEYITNYMLKPTGSRTRDEKKILADLKFQLIKYLKLPTDLLDDIWINEIKKRENLNA